MKRDPITTHVLDTSRGQPASDIPVSLSRCAGESLEVLGSGHTDDDGRIMNGLVAEAGLEVGVYEIRFDVAGYFKQLSQTSFYPEVRIRFEVRDAGEHYHVPLLLSPFGYSTYRGS